MKRTLDISQPGSYSKEIHIWDLHYLSVRFFVCFKPVASRNKPTLIYCLCTAIGSFTTHQCRPLGKLEISPWATSTLLIVLLKLIPAF